MKPVFFASPEEFRQWLEKNHATADEVFVGFHKVATGRPTLTWSQSVDEALCFGWIDGRVNTLDSGRYVRRFTPRKKGSIWSNINIEKVKRLVAEGRMQPAGLTAFGARTKSGVYSFEQRQAAQLSPDEERAFRKVKSAWAYFEDQAPWYRRAALWWVVSAKREATRAKRFSTLVACSKEGRPISLLARPSRKRTGA